MSHHVERRLATQAILIAAASVVLTSLALTGPVASQQPTQAQRDAVRAACRSDYEAHCASVPPGGKPALMCLQKNLASLAEPCQRAVNAIVGTAAAAPPAQPPAPSSAAAAPASPATSTSPAASTASPAAPANPPAAAPPAPATVPKAAMATGARRPSQAQVAAIRQACRADYQAACAGVPTGGAAALNCLQKNVATLSAPCQQAVNAAGGASTAAEPAASGGGQAIAGAAAPAAMPRAMSPRQEIRLVRLSCGRDFRALCGGVAPGGGRVIECLRANEASLSPRCQSAMAGMRR